jgi:predicted Zn-dependent protease
MGWSKRGWGPVLALGLLLAGSAAAGHGKKAILIGEAEEREIGARMAARIRSAKSVLADRSITDYVNRTGQHIARLSDRPDIVYRFAVIQDKAPTAFALPGGYIYVHTGLLKMLDSQSQLAGVLGHEIGHVVGRHGVKRLQDGLGAQDLSGLVHGASGDSTRTAADSALVLILGGYDKNMESEADDYAEMYMARSGLNPEGLAQAMDKVAKASDGGEGYWEALAKNHPPAAKRVAGIRSQIKSRGLDAGLPLDPEPYRAVKSRVP